MGEWRHFTINPVTSLSTSPQLRLVWKHLWSFIERKVPRAGPSRESVRHKHHRQTLRLLLRPQGDQTVAEDLCEGMSDETNRRPATTLQLLSREEFAVLPLRLRHEQVERPQRFSNRRDDVSLHWPLPETADLRRFASSSSMHSYWKERATQGS